MVGQVEVAQREPDRIFRIDLDVLRDARIDGEEAGVAGGVGDAYVLLGGVHGEVWKAGAVFDHRRNAPAAGNWNEPQARKRLGTLPDRSLNWLGRRMAMGKLPR